MTQIRVEALEKFGRALDKPLSKPVLPRVKCAIEADTFTALAKRISKQKTNNFVHNMLNNLAEDVQTIKKLIRI